MTKRRRRWLGKAVLSSLLVGAIPAAALLARPGIVKYKSSDGTPQQLEGDVNDAETGSVTITVHGVQTTIPRENVTGIEYAENFEQQYNARLSKLKPDDVRGRLDLARYAFDNRQYMLARNTVVQVQKIDPNNREAADMMDTIQRQIALDTRTANPPPPPSSSDRPAPGPGPAAGGPPADQGPAPQPERRFLTNDDVNAIRQAELNPQTDVNVRVQFLQNVKQRYVAANGVNPAVFNGEPQLDQATDILRTGDPKLTRDVRVLTDPVALSDYHRLQPRILSGCASAGCHGGGGGGNFVLYNPADTVPAWYTNYYILQNYTQKVKDLGSTFGKGPVERRMIDASHPEQSLLLQYGMPQNVANIPHPQVEGYHPLFQSADDPLYRNLINWMTQDLRPNAPDYGIRFDLPTGTAPTTRPAPATAPAAEQ